jgi:hypothetical protein
MSDDLAAFNTLDFYPINEKFFVTANFVRTKEKLLDENIDGRDLAM